MDDENTLYPVCEICGSEDDLYSLFPFYYCKQHYNDFLKYIESFFVFTDAGIFGGLDPACSKYKGADKAIINYLDDKARKYSKDKNFDMAVFCYERRNEYIINNIQYYISGWSLEYTREQLGRYSIALMRAGKTSLSEENFKWNEKFIRDTFQEGHKQSIHRHLEEAKDLGFDCSLVEMDLHDICCGECAKYQGRVFSIDGTDSRYPKLPEQFLDIGGLHPGCRHSILPYLNDFLFAYVPSGIDPIAWSNRPFIDDRSEENKIKYQQMKSEEMHQYLTIINKLNYYWLQLNLPELTPKSFNAYSRMKNANTATFRAIQDAARSKGREI